MPTRPPVHVPPHGTAADARQAADRDRGSSDARGYNAQWRRFRLIILASNPLCVDCTKAGRITAAREVHHLRKVRDAPELMFEPTNVRALCTPCHSLRTARGE